MSKFNQYADTKVEESPPVDLGFELSSYQEAIKEAVQNTKDNLIIEAVAGSGKTTTGRLIVDVLPKGLRVCNLCFNKSVADEASRIFPARVECRTMHALGMSALRFNGNIRVSQHKTSNILKYDVMGLKSGQGFNTMTKDDREFYFEYRKVLVKLVSLAKSGGIRDAKKLGNSYIKLAQYHELDAPDTPEFRSVLEMMLEYSWNKTTTIDFDDMIWQATLDSTVHFPTYDVIIVDEAQDLNIIQRMMLNKILSNGGRLIAIGDGRQSIYGFRGVDNNSMQKIRDLFGCRELPLSICYRCDKNIVEKAKEFVPQIEAKAGANSGIMLSIQMETFYEQVQVGDFVLCRLNAPLVSLCPDLLSKGYDAKIVGKDMSDRLLTEAKKIEKDRGVINKYEIEVYLDNRVEELKQKEKFYEIRGLTETCDILMAFGIRYSSLSELKKLIYSIFRADKKDSAIRLSTIHKVKGMEADRVFIIAPELLPIPWATQPWQLEQEKNLEYVAVTRARKELYYVEG